MKKERGFVLVEIMIVVALVLILVTVAMPNILRSRIIANETSVIAALRVISTACDGYRTNQGTFPGSLSDLIQPVSNPPYMDSSLASGSRYNYTFTYEFVDANHFTLNVDPTSLRGLNARYFYLDETGVIRFRTDGPAGGEDEVVK